VCAGSPTKHSDVNHGTHPRVAEHEDSDLQGPGGPAPIVRQPGTRETASFKDVAGALGSPAALRLFETTAAERELVDRDYEEDLPAN
jgi:hypothetical protein